MYSWRRAIRLIRLSYFQLNFHYIHQSHTLINHDRTAIMRVGITWYCSIISASEVNHKYTVSWWIMDTLSVIYYDLWENGEFSWEKLFVVVIGTYTVDSPFSRDRGIRVAHAAGCTGMDQKRYTNSHSVRANPPPLFGHTATGKRITNRVYIYFTRSPAQRRKQRHETDTGVEVRI